MTGDVKMEECLVCGAKESSKGKKCKMCGMHSDGKTESMGFVFCSEKCKEHFKRILDSADEIMREELLKKETII